MKQIQFINLKKQYELYKNEIDKAISNILENTCFIQGPEVEKLEQELAKFTGSKHCISCSSGTDALYISLKAVGIGSGDEVITTSFTFFATAGAVLQAGAKPVFVDVERDSMNINSLLIESAITKKTKAIIPVGLYGQPADMDVINDIAKKYNLIVIEDAAQSFGSEYNGKKSCNLSDIGCTSFYPAKPLGCYGEGGAVFTNNDELAVLIRQIMNQGQRTGYDHAVIGLNGRLQAIQAAVLRVKLRHFSDEIVERNRIAQEYKIALSQRDDIMLPFIKENRTSVFAQYTIRSKKRDELRKFLSLKGVPTAVHYPKPVFKQDAYICNFNDISACPECEAACDEVLSLPFSPFLSEDEYKQVITAILEF